MCSCVVHLVVCVRMSLEDLEIKLELFGLVCVGNYKIVAFSFKVHCFLGYEEIGVK